MEIDFGSSGLDDVEGDDAPTLSYPVSVIKSLQRKLHLLRQAPDERTMRNWKSLHYEKLKGKRSHQNSIRLNDQWRLVFEHVKGSNGSKIVIIGIEDYH